MKRTKDASEGTTHATLAKVKTGISGFDDITGGGLPKGRPTLICGGPGCGKTLFAMEFLVRGSREFGEPGVFISFEESGKELAANVKSLGFDVGNLEKEKQLLIDQIVIERSEIEETGDYDLEGLFVRLGHAIDSIGAKRVALDTLEALFSSLNNEAILRSELRRLFRFLKDKGVTAVITGEKGERTLTKQGLEEYVSDCVIYLDHRVHEQLSTRRLRVVKYRGTHHGTNEYPFLITAEGFSVLPVTSMGLHHSASYKRVSSGLGELDKMLDGKGYFMGSTVMVTGPAGSAKTSFASYFANEVCSRGKRVLYFSFEESAEQIIRNMSSIGINLNQWVDKKILKFVATRPSYYGLEMHLAQSIKFIQDFKPEAVIIDPLTDLMSIGSTIEVNLMLARLIDFLKNKGITAFVTGLRALNELSLEDETGVSSLIDTWLMLGVSSVGGKRNRIISIIKSRGMPHSNETREFIMTDKGVKILNLYEAEYRNEQARNVRMPLDKPTRLTKSPSFNKSPAAKRAEQ